MGNGTVYAGTSIEIPSVQLYRKPHDKEIRNYDQNQCEYLGDGYRNGPVRSAVIDSPENPHKRPMPEVYKVWPEHQTLINCDWLHFWWRLNPMLSKEKFSTLLDNKLAWTNGTGFPERRNCITGARMDDPDAKDPAFHAPIINGGAILKRREGAIEAGWFEIDGFLTSDPIPDPATVIRDYPWKWFYGTAVTESGKVNYIVREGLDGLLYPVRVPILTRLPIKIREEYLHKLPRETGIPDSRWMA